ncbi:MAG: multidrug efflux SMR transporter [Paracoccus sp. (in: a-proteobacteria)]|nr:multidrug efflux SMR transporter [Paracoccus sp. (in: a-proteobacteria)]
MPWIQLAAAGFFEVVWAVAMKQSQGFSRLLPTGIMVAGMIASFWLLALAMRSLPLGTAYAVWTGIGAIGSFLIGMALMGEPITPLRILAATLILSGIVVMKIAS